MRLQVIPAFVLLLGVPTCAVAGEAAGSVALFNHGGSKPTKAVADTLRKLGVELLKSSNLNTAAHPGILKQSVPAIQDRCRRVVARDCLVITYDAPVKVRTVGGEVSVYEIVIGLAHPDSADALFTIDEGGRIVAHEKYSGRIAVELRKAVDPQAFESGSIRIGFSIKNGQWVKPLNEFFVNGFDIEQSQERGGGKVLVVRIDLDGDGTRDYFVQDTSTCGNGGCPYLIIDGRTKLFLGSVFGTEVWLLNQKAHGMPIIQAYGHVAADSGLMGRYEFNGSEYEKVSSQEIGGAEETELFYRKLYSAPRYRSP